MKKQILITAKVHTILQETFLQNGYDVIYEPDINYEQLKKTIAPIFGLVITTKLRIDKTIIDEAKNLKWIGRLGSGLELIDIDYAQEKGISCISTPDGNSTAVAEHILTMLLAYKNKLIKSTAEVKQKIWLRNENRGTELTGKTIGIIGFGHTGSALAKILQGFDVTILAHDKYKPGFGNGFVKETSISDIVKNADIISFNLPLTTETKYYANDIFFNSLVKTPIIINTSRGGIVESKALINALESKKISAALLDVLENEKLDNLSDTQVNDFNYLSQADNVIITPHIAGYTYEAFYKMSYYLLKKLGEV